MGYFGLIVLLKVAQVTAADSGRHWHFWGPGLDGSADTPTRYFWGILLGKNGEQLDARQFKKEDVQFQLISPVNGKKIWSDTEFGWRFDGAMIFRYRLRFSLTDGVTLRITIKDEVVLEHKSVNTHMYDEACYCPSSLKKFYFDFECPVTFDQMEEDFARFPKKIDLDQLFDAGVNKKWSAGKSGEATAHVVIKNQELYIRDLGTIMGFRFFIESMFLSILRKVRVPDVEFVFNLGDWPLEHNFEAPLPIFSWCGSINTTDIVLPTWEQTKTTRWALFRERKDLMYVEQISGECPPWEKKIEKGFFRGRDSNPARLTLCEMSMKNPDVIDSRLTWNLHNKKGQDPKKYGEQVKHVPYTEMGKYKYQVLVDGTVAPYRTAFLMQMDSVVLKQDSDYYEWWYTYLKPNVHYIPVEKDLSNLFDQIQWAKSNDQKAKQIALNANALVAQWMTPEIMYCYYVKAFEKYSKMMSRPVKVTDKHDHIPQSADGDLNGNWEKYWAKPSCKSCHKKKAKDEL